MEQQSTTRYSGQIILPTKMTVNTTSPKHASITFLNKMKICTDVAIYQYKKFYIVITIS